MDFFSKIRETYLTLPFPIRILIGVGFFYIFPPLGIGLIILAVFLRRKNRYNRRNSSYDNAYDAYREKKMENPQVAINGKKNGNEQDYNKKNNFYKNDDHVRDLKSAEKILNKTRDYMKKGNLKEEMKGIYVKMQTEFENARKTTQKINEINNMLSDPDWNLDRIRKNILTEKNKTPQDPKRLERMYEMHNHILQLHERKARLCNQISDLNISFQTIYTKLTLLDMQEESDFDGIETEIQRILDFKLKVDQYEDQLDKEMKEFL